MEYGKQLFIVATALSLAGCGGSASKPSRHVQAIHHATATVLAEQVNGQVEAGGVLLLVHRQASEPIARSWAQGLAETLDSRFTVVRYGLEEMSEAAATSEEGAPPLAEGMQKHADAVAVISAIQVDPAEFASLPGEGTPMFALEWPFLEEAGDLLSSGQLKAGVFERANRDATAKPQRGASPLQVISPRYVLATPDNWRSLVGL